MEWNLFMHLYSLPCNWTMNLKSNVWMHASTVTMGAGQYYVYYKLKCFVCLLFNSFSFICSTVDGQVDASCQRFQFLLLFKFKNLDSKPRDLAIFSRSCNYISNPSKYSMHGTNNFGKLMLNKLLILIK